MKNFLILLVIFCFDFSISTNEKSVYNSCSITSCSNAMNLCLNCQSETTCKNCIVNNRPECTQCANGIFDENELEYIDGSGYLLCDSTNNNEFKICQIFCRGQNLSYGTCSRVQNIPVCECHDSTGQIINIKPNFQGILKFNFTNENDRISSLKVLKNGNIVTSDWNGKLRIWDSKNGYLIRKFDAYEDVERILSLDDGTIITVGEESSIRFWNNDGSFNKSFETFVGNYLLALNNSDLVMDYSPYIKIIDSNDGSLKYTRNIGEFDDLLSTNDKIIAFYYSKKELKVFDLTGLFVRAISLSYIFPNSFPDKTLSAMLNHEEIIIFTDLKFAIININTGVLKLEKMMQSDTYELYILNDSRFVTAERNATIKVWNSNGSIVNIIVDPDFINSEFNLDLTQLKNGNIVTAFDNFIKIWNISNGELVREIILDKRIISLECLSNGNLIIVTRYYDEFNYDAFYEILNPNSGNIIKAVKCNCLFPYHILILDNGDVIIAEKEAGNVIKLNPDGLSAKQNILNFYDRNMIGVSNNHVIALACVIDELKLLDLNNNTFEFKNFDFDFTSKEYGGLDFLQNDRFIVGSKNKSIDIWDLKTQTKLHSMKDVQSFKRISNNKNLIAIQFYWNSNDKRINLYDSINFSLILTIRSINGTYQSNLALISEKYMAVSYDDGTLEIWDIKNSILAKSFQAHNNYYFIDVLPNGNLVSCDSIGNIKIWN